jgi:hypothetical protein
MLFWISGIVGAMAAAIALHIWHRRRRARLVAARRVVEKPNSAYAAPGVVQQVERTRWSSIDLDRLHPINREEVERLLEVVDTAGPQALSRKDRIFLDNMTVPRFS